MTIDECVSEWKSKKRKMGCVAATEFVCKRVPGFAPKRFVIYTEAGERYDHVVATDGRVVIDLVPHLNSPAI